MSEEETSSQLDTVEEAEEKKPESATKAEEPVKKEAKEETEITEEEIEIVEEKFYTVSLRDVWAAPRKQRAPKAVRIVKNFVKRRMKTEDVQVSNEINEAVWARSIQKPPRKLQIRVVKDKEGQVIIFPVKSS